MCPYSSKYHVLLNFGFILLCICGLVRVKNGFCAVHHNGELAIYNKGMEYINDGKWEQALNLWSGYLNNLVKEKKSNPAVAFKYIEVVTEHHLRKDYYKASSYYLKTFEYASWDNEPKFLLEELKRIMPIVPHKLQKQWKKEIKKKNPDIFRKVVLFWEMLDPITSTPENERLIEHWKRIAYAREHFTRASNTVYHTDDRGLIYVRFGKPDVEEKNIVLPPNQIMNPVTGGPLLVHGMIIHPMIPIILETDLWKYKFSNRAEPSYYLFGSDQKGGGEYRLQTGIMHLIPSLGYSLPLAGMDRRGGALMIKYSMIEKLRGVTGYYDKIYNELTNAIISRSVNRGMGQNADVFQAPDILFRFESREYTEAQRRDIESPGSTTDLITQQNIIPVDYKYYRYLNSDKRTEYLLVMNPNLKKIDKRLSSRNLEKHPLRDIYMRSSLIAFDKRGYRHVFAQQEFNLLQIIENQGSLSYYFNPDTTGRAPITGIDFFGEEGKRGKHKSVTYGSSRTIFSSGPIQLPLPDSLTWKPGHILISDPILGYKQKVDTSKHIPFIPVLKPTFLNGSEVLVYFEVYDQSISDYSVKFSYEKYPSKILKIKPKPYNENADVITLFKREHNTDREWIYLKLNGFEPGDYNLKMTVKDNKGNIQDIRTAKFKIAETPG